MSTQAELHSGVTILSASLLMHSVSAVTPSGLVRDFFGIFSVLSLIAGIGVVGVGLAHRVTRAKEREPSGHQSSAVAARASLGVGAICGIGIGSFIGSLNGDVLGFAIGISIGSGVGVALGAWWDRRQRHGPDRRPETR